MKHSKRPHDVNQLAYLLVEQSTAQLETLGPLAHRVPASVSEYMATIGRKGGRIGGKRRLSTHTEQERKNFASAAAMARWQKAQKPDD